MLLDGLNQKFLAHLLGLDMDILLFLPGLESLFLEEKEQNRSFVTFMLLTLLQWLGTKARKEEELQLPDLTIQPT